MVILPALSYQHENPSTLAITVLLGSESEATYGSEIHCRR